MSVLATGTCEKEGRGFFYSTVFKYSCVVTKLISDLFDCSAKSEGLDHRVCPSLRITTRAVSCYSNVTCWESQCDESNISCW